MKKLLFGAVIFFGGLLSLLSLITSTISVYHTYRFSFLLDEGGFTLFIISLIFIIVGLFICLYEAYGEEIKSRLKK